MKIDILLIAACFAIGVGSYAIISQRAEVVRVAAEDDCSRYHGALELSEVVRIDANTVACVYPWGAF